MQVFKFVDVVLQNSHKDQAAKGVSPFADLQVKKLIKALLSLQIFGIKYGLRGFYSRNAKPVELNAHAVEGIHLRGGTILVCRCPCSST